VERTGEYRGLYVSGGALSPLDGVEPGDLGSTGCLRASSRTA
jgi:recombinational DNA repair protein RecR